MVYYVIYQGRLWVIKEGMGTEENIQDSRRYSTCCSVVLYCIVLSCHYKYRNLWPLFSS